MALKTTRLDIAQYLETDEDIAEFLQETASEGTEEDFIHALSIAARARGMTEVARQAGVTRSSLYKSLAEGGNPEFSTIARVCAALGVRLTAIRETVRKSPPTPVFHPSSQHENAAAHGCQSLLKRS
jgi:probable addiction module antidote protein